MIHELAKELGISEHALFAAVERIIHAGSTDRRNGVSMSWDREDFAWSPDGMRMEHSPSWKTLVMIYGPTEKVNVMATAAMAKIDKDGNLVNA